MYINTYAISFRKILGSGTSFPPERKQYPFVLPHRPPSLPASSTPRVEELLAPPPGSSKLRLPGPPVCPVPDVTFRLQRPAGFRLPIGLSDHGLLSPPMAAALGGRVPTFKMAPPGAASGWPAAGKRPGLALRLRGPGGISPGTPLARLQGLPRPEQWPPRTASSFGRGAPSCRGGKPRTPRGRDWTKPFQILSPKSRGPGAPPTSKGWFGAPGSWDCLVAAGQLSGEGSGQRASGMAGCGSTLGSGVWGRKGAAAGALSRGVAGVWA